MRLLMTLVLLILLTGGAAGLWFYTQSQPGSPSRADTPTLRADAPKKRSLTAPGGGSRYIPPPRRTTTGQIDDATKVQFEVVKPRIQTVAASDEDLPEIDADANPTGPTPFSGSSPPRPATETPPDTDSAMAPAASATQPGLAVIPFKHLGTIPQAQTGQLLASLLLTEIDSQQYQLYERSQIQSLVEELRFQESDLVSNASVAAKFGRMAGIRYLVIGDVGRLGNTYHLSARVVDCQSGHIAQKGRIRFRFLDHAEQKLRMLASLLKLTDPNAVVPIAPPVGEPEPPQRPADDNGLIDVVNPQAPFEITIRTGEGKQIYQEGEQISFEVMAQRDCFLTLVTVDSQGKPTLLLPNAWQPQAFVRRGQVVRIPSPDAGFQFTVNPPHGETFVKAIATPQPLRLRGVSTKRIEEKGFVELDQGVKAIGVERADRRQAESDEGVALSVLFESNQWATAELTLITHDPKESHTHSGAVHPPSPNRHHTTSTNPPPTPPAPDAAHTAKPNIKPEIDPGGHPGGRPGVGVRAGANDEVQARFEQLSQTSLKPAPILLEPMGLAGQNPEELLVFYRPQATQGHTKSLPRPGDGPPVRDSKRLRMRVVKLQPHDDGQRATGRPGTKSLQPADPQTRARELEDDPGVALVVPNYQFRSFAMPVTHYASVQWALRNTFNPGNDTNWFHIADQASRIQPPLIAVIDQGLDLTDPRLRALAWTNDDEIENNGIDDDKNGYVDDRYGYNFHNQSPQINPSTGSEHGSFISSVIAGRVTDDPDSVIGMAPNAKILSIVTADREGHSKLDAIIAALEYAADQGAKIINLSLGGVIPRDNLKKISQLPIWDELEQRGIILVCAAGNSFSDNDRVWVFPANIDRPNVISVMAVDPDGKLAHLQMKSGQWIPFSNYGRHTVDLAAPGSLILGIPSRGQTTLKNGTSFAAPMVTAAAGLVWGQHPNWSHSQVIRAVTESARTASGLQDKCRTSGILDLRAALQWTP